MSEAVIAIEGHQEPLRVRINGADPTFQLATEVIRAKAVKDLDPVLMDLLEIAATVFAADGSIGRGGKARPHMGRDWRRNLSFRIPVQKPEIWEAPEVCAALVDAVGFLTEDEVSFHFDGKPPEPSRQPFLSFDQASGTFEAADVILFSGGLDSFAGALETLSSGTSNVLLVTHRSAQKVITRQVELGQYLQRRFEGRVLHVQVQARMKNQSASEATQRSRSLLFAALGQVVAQSFGAKRVNFFENGFISHNLPLTPQVVGTMATRTTHPLALQKLAHLINLVGPEPVPMENKFRWLTKKEVVSKIRQCDAAEQIPKAVSCTSTREQNKRHTHCGACSQCLDRRFAMLAAGLGDFDFAEDYETEVLHGQRLRNASITMALEWTRHSLHLGQLDETQFLSKYGHEAMRIVRGHPEMTRAAALQAIMNLHKRHAEAVKKVLTEAVIAHASDIATGTLEPSSLLARCISAQSIEPMTWATDARAVERRTRAVIDGAEEDCVHDPQSPLEVEFLKEAAGEVVSVKGLCRITGKPTVMPWALKPMLLEDRLLGLPVDEHRFTWITRIPGLENLSEATLRQLVKRCRDTLKQAFRQVHGEEPSEHLLIQNKPGHGYRLDPTIEILRDDSTP